SKALETTEGPLTRPLLHGYRCAPLEGGESELGQALALVRVLPQELLEPWVEEADRLADHAAVGGGAAVGRPKRRRHVDEPGGLALHVREDRGGVRRADLNAGVVDGAGGDERRAARRAERARIDRVGRLIDAAVTAHVRRDVRVAGELEDSAERRNLVAVAVEGRIESVPVANGEVAGGEIDLALYVLAGLRAEGHEDGVAVRGPVPLSVLGFADAC